MKKVKRSIVEALDYLEQNPSETLTKAATLFGVDRHTLSDYRCKKTFDRSALRESCKNGDEMLYCFSERELEILEAFKKYTGKITFLEFKKLYPDAPDIRTLKNWMNIIGAPYHTGNIFKYHYNTSAFQAIETEKDAYWLGFITADGCITNNDKVLQIKLAERDRSHLVKFCKYLQIPEEEIEQIIKSGIGGAYTRDNPICVIKICNQEIIKNLKDKGIEPRKSGNEHVYKCDNLQLETAYIRGLIDGDGYLASTDLRIGLVGSKEICQYFHSFVNENITNVENSNHIYQKDTIWGVSFAGKFQAPKVAKFIYDNASIYLDRKYELFQEKYNF